jgi:hypothetical protein
MGYVNHKGEPLDLSALREAAAHQRRLERQAGVVHRTPTVKRGYAAPPGTGPDGKTCADCVHKRSFGRSGGKHFIKCELRRSTWTHGEGTDILARSPACNKFNETEQQPC